MKRLLVVSLVVMLVFSFACSKKEEKAGEAEKAAGEKVGREYTRVSLIDPVSREFVDYEKSTYSYVYNNTKFLFENKSNMEEFKKNPEKYLKKK